MGLLLSLSFFCLVRRSFPRHYSWPESLTCDVSLSQPGELLIGVEEHVMLNPEGPLLLLSGRR